MSWSILVGKPPDNLNPENFIIGEAKCNDNYRIAAPMDDEREFRLDPAPMPVLAMIVKPCLVIGFLAGWLWVWNLLSNLVPGGRIMLNDVLSYVMAIFLGAFGCFGYGVWPFFRFRYERKRGSWFVYDKATRRVRLPRIQQEFDFHEIVYLQCITTKPLKRRADREDRSSELNLVTYRNGERKRWQVLASTSRSRDFFDYLLGPLVQHTKIPILKFWDSYDDWDVTIEPFTADDALD